MVAPSVLLSIDPGRHSGCAWWRDGELVLVRRLELGHHAKPDVIRCVAELQSASTLIGRGPDRLVIEDQWMAQGGAVVQRGSGFDAVKALVATRATWCCAAQVIWGPPPEIELVMPSTWMSALVGGKAGKAGRVRPYVEAKYPGEAWTEDQIAAVGIGLWATGVRR